MGMTRAVGGEVRRFQPPLESKCEPYNKLCYLFLIFCLQMLLGLQFWDMKEYFVYMLTNKYHNVLYIGFTNNIRRRVYEHKRKIVYGFTSKYNCTKLVWYEKFSDVNLAIAREKQLKTWQRSWKNNLIEKLNPDWHDLAADWFVKSTK